MRLKKIKKYYKQIRVSNFWSNKYTGYKKDGDRNKTLPIEEYLNHIRPYFKYMINNLKKSDTRKFQLAISNNFIFLIDNDEEDIMH